MYRAKLGFLAILITVLSTTYLRLINISFCKAFTADILRRVLHRADKEKQQLTIEIDGLVTQVDAANKAKVK